MDKAMLKVAPVELVRREADLLLQLSYPKPDQSYAESTLSCIEELGVEGVELAKEGRLRILGKGFRNIVVCGLMRRERVAIKVRRQDYGHKDAWREAYMLERANSLGIGPRLLGQKGQVIVMSLVEGTDLTSWLLTYNPSREAAIKVLIEMATQCHRLDEAMIDHGELSDASKHVILSQNHPTIIDFGSASFSTRPKNLTSIINYIYSAQLEMVRQRLGLAKVGFELLRRYKEAFSSEDFLEILTEMGLLGK
ncbi:MAG: RIO1 family regulatory kinase/ATPase [Nitrososphaerota archaeon]